MKGNPSALFGPAKIISTTQQHHSYRDANSTTNHSESIVHRLNHLTLLINSSGIDLNIALNESDFQASLNATSADSVDSDLSSVESQVNNTLTSLASQSTKRRSILPTIKVTDGEAQGNNNKSILANKSIVKDKKLSNVGCAGNGSVTYIGKEGLLDAFLVLYDECCTNEKYKNDTLLQDFVKKYQPYAAHLARLRVSLSDFECLRVIGRGHFGVVQLVKEITTGQVYALKTLRKDDTLQQKHVALYEEERDIMAKATSPWITKLQYAFQDPRHLYLVMEYLPGGDLLSLLERQQDPDRCLPESWVVFYLAQTTTALHHLHNMGYVHRDVKPDNLLLDRCGHIKLADFGSSCRVMAVADGTSATAGKVTAMLPAGTPDYLAPEVLAAVEGDHAQSYGISCDFWSVGIVAYEMLFGETPFASDKMINTYTNIMQYQSKLQFPEECEVSSSAISLIRGLVCDASERLDYQAITHHAFFLHTDYNALHDMVPPFIPVVSSPDDTSNFDSFSDTPSSTAAGGGRGSIDTSSFRTGTTLGKRVSFVGFTYARPPLGENSSVTSATGGADDESVRQSDATTELVAKLETELLQKKKLLHDLQLKAEDSSSGASVLLAVQHAKSKAQMLEKDRDGLKTQLNNKEANIAALKKQVTSERAERATMESKTLSLIKDIKMKWKKEEERRLADLNEKCEIYEVSLGKEREAYSTELEKHKETLQELGELQHQALQYRKLAHQKDKELRVAKQNVSSLEEQLTSHQDLGDAADQSTITTESEARVQELKSLGEKLQQAKHDIRSITEERDSLISTVRDLENDYQQIRKLERELSQLKEQLDDMETKSFHEMESLTKGHDKAVSVKDTLLSELKSNLQVECRERSHLKSKLKSVTEELSRAECKLGDFEKQFEDVSESKQAELVALRKELEEASHNIKDKDRVLLDSKKREDKYKGKIMELESLLNKLDSTVQQLEARSRKNNSISNASASAAAVAEAQKVELGRVVEQLKTAREAAVKAGESYSSSAKELEKEQGEVSRLKLDVKLAEREVKSAQERIAFLRECNKDVKEMNKQHQASIKQQEEEKDALQLRIAELEDEVTATKQTVDEQKQQQLEAEKSADGRVAELEEVSKAKKEINKKLMDARAELDQMKLSKRGVVCALEQSKQEQRIVQDGTVNLHEKIREQQLQINKLEEGSAVLKDLCSEQDQQLCELETFEEKIAEHEALKNKLKDDISKLQTEVKAARAQTNEEKSLKTFQERQVKSLESELKSQEQQQDQETAALQKHVETSVQHSVLLEQKILELEKQLYESESQGSVMMEREDALKGEVALLQEETAGHITHIHTLKQSNFQLTQGLEEALDKATLFKKKMEESNCELAHERHLARDADIKNKMTLEQHTKLIDFLQTKLDDKMKKKKTLSSKLFGSGKDKENYGSLTPYKTRSQLPDVRSEALLKSSSTDLTTKTVSCMVQSSPHPSNVPTQQCKLLRTPSQSLTNAQHVSTSEFKTPAKSSSSKFKTPSETPTTSQFKTPNKSTAALKFKTPSQTPSSGRNLSDSSSRQRMRHNIPHRFERTMVVHGGRCSGCLSSVPRGRFAYRCSHCQALAHKHCCPGVPATCGLPTQLAHHFTGTDHAFYVDNDEAGDAHGKMIHEGWVKIPRSTKACWEFCFARLLASGKILVFDHEPGDCSDSDGADLKPCRVVNLCVDGCRAEVVSAVPRSEIPATSTVDLPYVLKIDVRRSYQQSVEKLYLMTSNFEQKLRWVAALEHVLFQCSDSVSCSGDSGSSIHVQKLVQLQHPAPASATASSAALHLPPHQPHSIIYIDNKVALLGCSEGLFSYSVNTSQGGTLTRKARLGTLTHVQQLLDIPSIEHIALIAGKDRKVYLLPYRTTMTAARNCSEDEPSVPHVEVAGVANTVCHLLAAGVTTAGSTFLCAAAEDRISILSWDAPSSSLLVVRQYGTQEACTSCLFTPAALIVAADKIYEIDLQTYTIEEFLDESDTSLAYAIYGTAHMASFPLAILQISESGKYGEFLICFNEFALFVDPYGQRSREHDIKFTRIPISVEYVKGSLFLLHSNSVEVLQIRSDSFTKVTTSDPNVVEFDTSSLSPSCHSAARNIAKPQLLGLANNPSGGSNATGIAGTSSASAGIVICSQTADQEIEVLRLTGVFPEEDLSATWPSLPSAITSVDKLPGDDSESVSSGVYSISDAETTCYDQDQHRGDKRKEQDSSKQVHFTSTKRSKKDVLK
uniref:non-specific serine/threonine protein kinase n=1 Tax=Hirondellea gigas TaxID=1518452 RepID=A0A6A7FRQ3_9CRUS